MDIPPQEIFIFFKLEKPMSVRVAGIRLGLVPACGYNPPLIMSAASPLSRLTGPCHS